MFRRFLALAAMSAAATLLIALASADPAQAQNPDWERFYHYPYIYYPHNFWGPEYFKASDHMYYRYPPIMQIPVYNKSWHNFYPEKRKYHSGKHFILDIF